MPDSLRRRFRAIARALYHGLVYIARALYDGLIFSGLSYGDPYAVWLIQQMRDDERPGPPTTSRTSMLAGVREPLRSSDVRRLLKEVEGYVRRNDRWVSARGRPQRPPSAQRDDPVIDYNVDDDHVSDE